MTLPEPSAYAAAWAAAWNARDLDAVLALFHDDVVFSSPVAARVLPETGGTVRGKDELRRYWSTALPQVPDLHFTVERVFAGVSVIVVSYRNQRGDLVDEVLVLDDDGLVVEGHGTYLVDGTPTG